MIKLAIWCAIAGIAIASSSASAAAPSAPAPASKYPERAPLSDYLIQSEAAEIALARSAAPASVADQADAMVLDASGYRTASKGTNGFVCMVWRSWSNDLGDSEFWNPKVRAPICLNPVAVRTVLPGYLQTTQWVLAGLGVADIRARVVAAVAKGEWQVPAAGAMSYMMSRQGHLSDTIGHASPHIMFFVPRADRQDWGANLPQSPIWGLDGEDPDPSGLFGISVANWSDGTSAAMTH